MIKKITLLLLCLLLSLNLAVASAQESNYQPINLHVQDGDIRVLLESLATLANVNMVLDDSVKGNITVKLQNINFTEALELITKSKGLAVDYRNGTYIVASKENLSKNYSQLRIIKLNYAKASELKTSLTNVVPAETLNIDDATNTIIFNGSNEQEQKLRAALVDLDVPVRQITLEAKVVSIGREDSKDLGVQWQWDNLPRDLNTEMVGGDSGETIYDGTIKFASHYAFKFNAVLNASIAKGNAKVLATPKITTLPGKEAAIFIGDNIPVITRSVLNGETTETVEYIEAGIKLTYTAHIANDNMITAKVHTEVSTPTLVSELKNYKVSSRKADTTVRLRNGETLVIGGLIGEEEMKVMSKIPFLGDLPILGSLFKNNSTRKTNTEVIIFLTPQIID